MAKAVALIRGVGGSTALKMAELREVAESTGLSGVATLQVAGNLIFDEPTDSLPVVAERLRRAMFDAFGHDLAVVTRTHGELVNAMKRNPFTGDGEPRFVHTVFLDAEPQRKAADGLDSARSPGDRFQVDGSEIFIHYANGVATSKLSLPWFERGLAVTGTARNANTVAKLVDLSA